MATFITPIMVISFN